MIPSISSLPSGYDCVVPTPLNKVSNNLLNGNGQVMHTINVYSEGQCIDSTEYEHVFMNGSLKSPFAKPFIWHNCLEKGVSGYLENSFRIKDNTPLFRTNHVLPFYSIYSREGKKSFFSDNAYLYASPPVISQIAEYGQYVDGYPVVRLDREKDYGESIIFINPYRKPLKATIISDDNRSILGIRVSPLSSQMISLAPLLLKGEEMWAGQIQITATNRVITFNVKHSFKDPTNISDHEHLDPYRGEPTHFPATQWLRLRLGKWLMRRGWIK
tara:strand:+ start:18815 stop:19627 length:813 start_codon:yes stop_codon:yes gene_type:complete